MVFTRNQFVNVFKVPATRSGLVRNETLTEHSKKGGNLNDRKPN